MKIPCLGKRWRYQGSGPMDDATLKDVIIDCIECWQDDETGAIRSVDGLADSLVESWLKDRNRAVMVSEAKR